MTHHNIISALHKRAEPETSWQSVLRLDNAKVTNLHYDQDSQRFLIAMELGAALDVPALEVLTGHNIAVHRHAILATMSEESFTQYLPTLSDKVLAVFDYDDMKPLGVKLHSLPLKQAFEGALQRGHHNSFKLFGTPRDYARRLYQFERSMLQEHAPDMLLPITADEAKQQVYRVSNDYRMMSPQFEVQSLSNIRSIFGKGSEAIAYFSLTDDPIGAGKLVVNDEATETKPFGNITTAVVLHEMAHAFTLSAHARPAHGHAFIHALADLYDKYSSLKKDVFMNEAIQQGLLPAPQNCPPALMHFDASVRQKFARALG